MPTKSKPSKRMGKAHSQQRGVMPRAARKHERVKLNVNVLTGEWSMTSAKTGENLIPGKHGKMNLNPNLRREA